MKIFRVLLFAALVGILTQSAWLALATVAVFAYLMHDKRSVS